METTRIQTVLRLPPELMERVLDQATAESTAFPALPPGFRITDEIRDLGQFELTTPAAEDLEADPKLSYLWEKYGRI